MNGLHDTHLSSIPPGKTLGKLDNSGHTKASRLLFRNRVERTIVLQAEGVRDRPMVDKPAAVAKAPFHPKVEGFQRGEINVITKRSLLTLAKDSMAGIISDIIVLAVWMSSHRLHDGGW